MKYVCHFSGRGSQSRWSFLISMAWPENSEGSLGSSGRQDMRITLHPSKPLVWWYNHRDSIDMSPPYQRRGRLWSASDKAYLIDSIINGFDIPKLYMADFQLGESRLNTSKLPYAIID